MRHVLAAISLFFLSLMWVGSYSYTFLHISSGAPHPYVMLGVEAGTITLEVYYDGVTPSNVSTTQLHRRMPDDEVNLFLEAYGMPPVAPAEPDFFRWVHNSNPIAKNIQIIFPIWPMIVLSLVSLAISLAHREKML